MVRGRGGTLGSGQGDQSRTQGWETHLAQAGRLGPPPVPVPDASAAEQVPKAGSVGCHRPPGLPSLSGGGWCSLIAVKTGRRQAHVWSAQAWGAVCARRGLRRQLSGGRPGTSPGAQRLRGELC